MSERVIDEFLIFMSLSQFFIKFAALKIVWCWFFLDHKKVSQPAAYLHGVNTDYELKKENSHNIFHDWQTFITSVAVSLTAVNEFKNTFQIQWDEIQSIIVSCEQDTESLCIKI